MLPTEVFVGEQGLHLLPEWNLRLGGNAVLLGHILGDSLPGEEVFQQEQGNCHQGKDAHENRIAVDILFQPHGQNHHGDHHTYENAGNQCPAQLADKLNPHFLRGAGGQRHDGVLKYKEVAGANGVVANQQEEEIIPIAVAQPILPGELENQRANGNRCKAENQIPGPHTSLPGGGVLHQPAIEQTSAHGKQLCNGHNHLIPAAHNANHIHIGGAVHSANLLGEELFHQCGNGIYNGRLRKQ